MATDAIFEDPHLAVDAIWRAGGGIKGVSVRVIRKSPDAVIGLGDNRFDLDAMLLDVRLSEIPDPTKGDQVDILDEDGEIQETVELLGNSSIDRRRAVRTVEVSAVQPDDPEP